MSWAEEDWTLGLSAAALRKVKELQTQQERLSREKQQRQLQLDSSQATLHKQTLKYEEVRSELQDSQRELQAAREEALASAGLGERLSMELQARQAQVCSLEGLLDTSRTLANTLTQEVKRLEAELEKLQNTAGPGDSMLFSTPCWNMTSPWEQNGGRQEEQPGQRDGNTHHGNARHGNAHHIRQRLQFSDSPKPPPPSFPRQPPDSTPRKHPSRQSDSSTPSSAVFPWERDDPKSGARGRLGAATAPPPPPPSSRSPPPADVVRASWGAAGDCGKTEDVGRDTDMSVCVSELQGRVGALEAELRTEAERLRRTEAQLGQTRRDLGQTETQLVQTRKDLGQTETQLGQARRDLAARESSAQRAHNELSQAHTRISKESERASSAEQKLKQMQEELKCQRQNAETSRLHAQQRTRDLEKQHQRDLVEQQKERQSLEKQHQQEVTKLSMELQQARSLHNALQAQAEKWKVELGRQLS